MVLTKAVQDLWCVVEPAYKQQQKVTCSWNYEHHCYMEILLAPKTHPTAFVYHPRDSNQISQSSIGDLGLAICMQMGYATELQRGVRNFSQSCPEVSKKLTILISSNSLELST